MNTFTIIHKYVPGIDILKKSMRSIYDIIDCLRTTLEIDNFIRKIPARTNTIGIIYDNQGYLPLFGDGIYEGALFDYFVMRLKQHSVTTIDIITCNLSKESKTLQELSRKYSIQIRYSLNNTGNTTDWILESHGVDIKSFYFNSNINEYKYVLGSSGSIFCFIDNDNKAYMCGDVNIDKNEPQVVSLNSVSVGSCGGGITDDLIPLVYSNTCIIKTDQDTFMGCGMNNVGQLGLNNTDLINQTFVNNATISNCVQVSCGLGHTGVISQSNVLLFGLNNDGQLGDGTNTDSITPITISDANRNHVIVSCGGYHTGIASHLLSVSPITLNLKCSGNNDYGQLGIGNHISTNTFQDICFNVSSNIGSFDCGKYHTIFTEGISGNIYACGRNHRGQLGINSIDISQNLPTLLLNISNATIVSCGDEHSAVIIVNGGNKRLFTFGDNTYGQLGHNSTDLSSYVPVEIYGGLTNVSRVSCGGFHTAVLLTDGNVYTFGWNAYGQLGDGTFTDSNIPVHITEISNARDVQCGYNHTMVILNDNTIRTFGGNKYGQLGINSSQFYPNYIENTQDIYKISCGQHHIGMVDYSGNVLMMGMNAQGQLGNGSTIDNWNVQTLTSISNTVDIACGANHTLVVFEDGAVKGYGDNQWGQLGDDTSSNDRTSPVDVIDIINATKVACGDTYSIVLLDDGNVKSFGLNDYGQLGTGDNAQYITPTNVINISNAVDIQCGNGHTLVLLENGKVKSFGYNIYGQLGDGSHSNSSTPIDLYGDISNVTQIAAGLLHSLILLNNGTVMGFGLNFYGQTGIPLGFFVNVPTLVPGLTDVVQIACGRLSSYALLSTGEIKCFGLNEAGELGTGNVHYNTNYNAVQQKSINTVLNGTSQTEFQNTKLLMESDPLADIPIYYSPFLNLVTPHQWFYSERLPQFSPSLAHTYRHGKRNRIIKTLF